MSMVPTPGDMVGATDPAKIDAAVAFLKYSTTIENQLKALEMTGLQPVSPQVEIPASLRESDPLMAEVLDIAGHAKITYGQNQAYWHQNVIDAFSTFLPELAFRNMTPEQFCSKLTEAALKN
jgi:raffinose/stachyose/melibiose transport system substrate-binding protein